jgi:hypothetical protein
MDQFKGIWNCKKTLSTLNENNTKFTKTVYVEATDSLLGSISLTADVLYATPSNSQFLSRIQTASDIAYYETIESNWTVNRNGGTRASAISSHGDTIFNLAKDIGLDPYDFKDWLTVTSSTVKLMNGASIPTSQLKVDDKLYGSQQFQIPNTILMAWFGEGGDLGKNWMLWKENQSELKQLGFYVVIFDNDSFPKDERYTEQNMPGLGLPDNAKTSFLKQINQLSNTKTLHGMYMMGHGSTDSIGSATPKVACIGPVWDVSYGSVKKSGETIGANLNYHLGSILIHACFGDNTSARNLKSDNGIFWGVDVVYYPGLVFTGHLVNPISDNWGLSYMNERVGGKQKTNQFIR